MLKNEDGVDNWVTPVVVLTVEEFLECLTELYVEDGVDNWVTPVVVLTVRGVS